ncbi:uncharacterized protein DSM5745_01159 [Aspergillus mulundensis]|uniref:EKC/KEOPS complex subunit BUD32 n=1 Tax=Aspergillus mulundensis TaxID=1810919 RepID=A0A3D8T5K1_9EURO|nr:hypothetical protein DSM5745_01159 [Aspergillus mulundensis]RDW93837.1 hypothetical protein DSM5745_01159 [Aspergillus mulundensis]
MSSQDQTEPCAAPNAPVSPNESNHETPELVPPEQASSDVSGHDEQNLGSNHIQAERPPQPFTFGTVHEGLGVDDTLDGCEGPWDYFPGGHHPVHLGDRIGPYEQYRVINKLGTGGFANTWLCRLLGKEPTVYVAIKIVQAHLSGEYNREMDNASRLHQLAKLDPDIKKYCLLPYDYFELEGPNGFHDCIVYPVAGPTLWDIAATVESPHAFLRGLARQAAEAMAVLHRNGLCHGDFRPSNILLRVDGLDGLSEEELAGVLDQPSGPTVVKLDNANPEANPPRYILRPALWITKRLFTDQICVIDFGESFNVSDPPEHNGIPFDYAPPELALWGAFGPSSDIWALALTMFEIRLGRKLFLCPEADVSPYLCALVHYFGKLPEPWWVEAGWAEAATFAIKEYRGRDVDPRDPEEPMNQDCDVVRRGTLQNEISRPVGHLLSLPDGSSWHGPLVAEERELFEDLIFTMMDLEPEKRPPVDEVLRHPWFSYPSNPAPDSPGPAPAGPELEPNPTPVDILPSPEAPAQLSRADTQAETEAAASTPAEMHSVDVEMPDSPGEERSGSTCDCPPEDVEHDLLDPGVLKVVRGDFCKSVTTWFQSVIRALRF